MSEVKLEEIVQISLGLTHTPKYQEQGVPFLSVKDISQGFINFEKCSYITEEEYNSLPKGAKPQIGDMLFCRVGTLGKPVIIEKNTPLFGTFVSLGFFRNKNKDNLELKYLYYWMFSKSFFEQIRQNVKGASQANLNTGWLSKFNLPLPPLEKQQEIAHELDEISEIIALRKEQIKKLNLLVKAKFVEMFGDPVVNPMAWEEKNLDDVSKNLDNRRVPITSNDRKLGKYPYYGASGIIDYVNDYIFDERLLLISEDGANLLARTTAIAFSVEEKCWINNHAHVLSFHATATQTYCEYLFNKIDLTPFVTGSAQPKLNQSKLNEISFPLPPLPLQEQFALYVQSVEEAKKEMEEGLVKMEMLFAERMQGYFG
ncbi:MAG: restriction endonuclease subunit S [Eubacteriales bacterium]